jgi:hypothetical protein
MGSEVGRLPHLLGRLPHLEGQSPSTSWIIPPPPVGYGASKRAIIVDQGRFDPRAMVLPRGLYKQGPWPLEEAFHETLIHYFQLGSAERGPLNGSVS